MPDYVLRVHLEESSVAETPVLINVRAPASDGGDMLIEGTEGETPYVASFTPKALAAARSSSSPIPASAWKGTLAHLLQYGPPPPLPDPKPSLSLTADLEASKCLTLHLRQTVAGGISQRLGDLELRADPDHEIDTLAWTATAVARSAQLTVERNTAAQRMEAAEHRARALSDQLEELVKARKDSEDAMLVSFADLLNEKKRKVRELQRCVEELRISEGAGEKKEVTAETKGVKQKGATAKGRKAGNSRTGKRKAGVEPNEQDETDETFGDDDTKAPADEDSASHDSSDFEQMRSPEAERDEESTEAESEDENEDEDAKKAQPANQPSNKRGVGKIGGKAASGGETHAKDEDKSREAGDNATSKGKDVEPPPRRELPFTRQQEAKKEAGADEGAETSDDEL